MRDEVDPFLVEVSLHGASRRDPRPPDARSGQLRAPGSPTSRGPALGLRLGLKAPLTAWNEHEIEAMYALADALGVPLEFDPQLTPRDNGDADPLAVAPSRAGVAAFRD